MNDNVLHHAQHSSREKGSGGLEGMPRDDLRGDDKLAPTIMVAEKASGLTRWQSAVGPDPSIKTPLGYVKWTSSCFHQRSSSTITLDRASPASTASKVAANWA